MAAYPTEGGNLPGQGELDFESAIEKLFLVMRVTWGGKFQSKFVIALSAEQAIELSQGEPTSQGERVSIAAVEWSKLRDDRHAFNYKWKERISRN
jgi:hypothetical protein